MLFNKGSAWIKQSDPMAFFNVSMRAFDNADVCDFLALYILDTLREKFLSVLISLYRNDVLGKTGMHLTDLEKKITIETNLTIVEFLDITLDLGSATHMS